MEVLSELEPKKVFHYFEEISNIPRGSYKEKAISDYLVAFAKAHQYEYWQDEIYNVVMKIPATEGRQDEAPLILQGHMDMVCEKTADCELDMEKDGLKLAIDGDYVYAKQTTLGGDDGIAVAYMLAIADDTGISHPALEYIITVSEEVGMDGAAAIDLSMLQGNQMLNLDSEEEGIFLCSCAGGLSAVSALPLSKESAKGLEAVQIQIDGLVGGHSGCEIDKEHANADILLGRVLYALSKKTDFYLVDIEGGKKDNAIPVLSKAIIGIREADYSKVDKICQECNAVFQHEYMHSDADICVRVSKKSQPTEVICMADTKKIIALLMTVPNGVMAMSTSVKGLVETSLNLGIMNIENQNFRMQHAIRSSVTSRKYDIFDKLCALVTSFGGTCKMQGEYPAWEYKEQSEVRKKIIKLYKDMYQKEPVMEGIHAGLECGLLADKIKNLDCVSMGPDILDIHTTSERLSISSTKRVYEFLLAYLEQR